MHDSVSRVLVSSIVRISFGIYFRFHIHSKRIHWAMSFGINRGICFRKREKIVAISSGALSRIFSRESVHMLTYGILFFKHRASISSTFSPQAVWPKDATLLSFFAHRRFQSMMKPICCRKGAWLIENIYRRTYDHENLFSQPKEPFR